MNKEEICRYAWMRGMSYEGLLHVASMMVNVEVPSKQEYEEYCVQAYRAMIASMVAEKYSEEDERKIAKRHLGFGFSIDNGVER